MNVHFLSLAILVTSTGFANAVEISQTGADVLIYPTTYSSEQGDTTLLTLRNDSEQGVVARVVVRNGENGSELAAFNLFMSPNDTWVGATIWNGSANTAAWVTGDETCTDAELVDEEPDIVGMTSVGQTWTEVYLLGALSEADTDRYTVNGSDDVVCPDQFDLSTIQVTPATNALNGEAQLVNVERGHALAVQPIGLSEFELIDEPTLLSALSTLSLASGHSARARIGSEMTEFVSSLDAVSATLMVASATISYSVEPIIGGQTHLLLTFPTRHLYEDTNTLFVDNTADETELKGQELTAEHADRNGRRYDFDESLTGIACSPPVPRIARTGPIVTQSQLNLSFAEPVFSYADTQSPSHPVSPESSCSSGFAEQLATDTGTYRLILSSFSLRSADGRVVRGLPALINGFGLVSNQTLPDPNGSGLVLSNYGWLRNLVVEESTVETP